MPAANADSFNSQVIKAVFTTDIKKNRPINEVLILENNIKKVYFYSEIKNMQGKKVYHTWEHRGKKLYQKSFDINEKTERLISSKILEKTLTGEWMVLISDENKVPIKAVMFKYIKKGSLAGKGIVPFR
ncbi:MAG: DUF2914 domain-containing protein [Gammaproteobacteria bacterium]|nr:DUF2914 domain-containing protein [Gammaproteobacteria bacterium]